MTATPQFKNEMEKVAYVRREVNAASDAVRARYPILDNQNLVGATVMAASVAVMLVCAYLYATGTIAW